MEYTIQDIQALISIAGQKNKDGLIQAMNSSGYPVAANISDADLFSAANNIFLTKGYDAIRSVLLKVPKINLTADENKNLLIKYQKINPKAKFFGDVADFFGDFLGGHGTTIVNPTNITSSSPISAKTMIYFGAGAIIAIIILSIIFKKSVS